MFATPKISQPLLSESYIQWVNRMLEIGKAGDEWAAQPARRNESLREFFAARSSH